MVVLKVVAETRGGNQILSDRYIPTDVQRHVGGRVAQSVLIVRWIDGRVRATEGRTSSEASRVDIGVALNRI